ncbi:HlyD family efflux transporter periplasmic adaptor subunit [Dickeya dianthicola]|uniref:HlyD family secretion protein n=1 Tax=Dickeya dianthicola TaxID=204039 RepID=UPI00137217EB|nr:HlyD family efflux transporter periplasmic adaptor subunit [Dickeya dianthicola]MCI4237591.1 HlyD family efflux transporter periplasmic adaptor subunit [Dickeya dianthicola]MCI4257029.1 HlyD family efflux transporter periplasmic adaptor subunit [Dickeya dianthicola]MZG21841.1 HlyD family efflux transporter periplasmic adaptor subunit [Dickeya dianthicola]MZI87999.1 HlyD family efflux transporter periplasmic adaptor subunit [Dickeya dianthicola]
MQDDKSTKKSGKKTALFIFPAAITICLSIYFLWTYVGNNTATTEDAYVEGNLVQVTSQVGGTIIDIKADNTDYVKRGDVVVVINPIDTKVQLDKAKAQLASTVRAVRNQFANLQQLDAAIEMKKADYNKATADYRRRSGLSKSMAISVEDMNHASDAVNLAKAAVKVAESQYNAALVYTSNTTPDSHPDVLTAEAVFRQAWLDWHRTNVIVPVSGVIAQRSIQVGQHISSGSTLMSIVPLDSIWVTANFKETQLGNIKVGQNATLTSDVHGRGVQYKGKILGIEPGTGSAFSLLPAQNATGNWIKVVQRIPVRIELDKNLLSQYPLRPGLSMKVKVDTNSVGTGEIRPYNVTTQKWKTDVYNNEDVAIDELIKQIVKENE